MSTAIATRPTKQPRKPVQRRLQWIPSDGVTADAVKIDDGRGCVCTYGIVEIGAIPGERGFRLTKLDLDDWQTYDVRVIDSRTATCDCIGGCRGKCKHADAIRKLISLGHLPRPECDDGPEREYDPRECDGPAEQTTEAETMADSEFDAVMRADFRPQGA